MKETPILFNGPMVKAINANVKGQTRRSIKRIAGFGKITEFGASDTRGYEWQFRDRRHLWNELRNDELLRRCPYGQPGDLLWVKHPCRVVGRSAFGFRVADGGFPAEGNDRFFYWDKFPHHVPKEGKSFGMGLPRMLSRLTLRITKIRVERLNEISSQDAWAEGVRCSCTSPVPTCKGNIDAFSQLWESINGKSSWATNPWVWVVSFKHEETGAA